MAKAGGLRMEDLAALAGVSKITVSRALRNSDLVREELREKIKALAEEHGYRLNSTARNLRLMRTHSVALVIEMDPSPERPMSDPILLAALGGLLQELTSAGYRVILTTRSQIAGSGDKDADGIILMGQGANNEAVHTLLKFGMPLVVWGANDGSTGGAVFVGSDNHAGGLATGRHLAATGRKHILYLGDPVHPEVVARIRGVTEGLDGAASLVVEPCDFNPESGRLALAKAIAEKGPFDAVVACSDLVAIGALDALKARGLDVPGDIAVVGFDDIATAAQASVPLTTVRQDWDAAGRVLARKMLEWLDGHSPKPELIPVSLIVRKSA